MRCLWTKCNNRTKKSVMLSAVLGPQARSLPAAKLWAVPVLLNPPPKTDPRDLCSRRVSSWEQPTSPRSPRDTRPVSGGGPGTLLLSESMLLQMVLCWRGTCRERKDTHPGNVSIRETLLCVLLTEINLLLESSLIPLRETLRHLTNLLTPFRLFACQSN